MATVDFTLAEVPNPGTGGDAWVATWANVTTSDTCSWLELPGYSDRSLQVTGTFGVGGHAKVQGTNDGTNAALLADPTGTAIDMTAAGVKEVLEIVRKIRPAVTAGDGTTSLTFSLLLMRTKR